MTAAVQSVLIFDIFILSFIAFLTRLYLSGRCQKPAGSTEQLEEMLPAEAPNIVEQEIVISRPPTLCDPHLGPYPWLMIRSGERKEHLVFYSILENQYHVHIVPELQDKIVRCWNKEWLVLMDGSTYMYSVLNIFTGEKVCLPLFNVTKFGPSRCMLSLNSDGSSWRVLIFGGLDFKLLSYHRGDSEFVEQEPVLEHSNYIDCCTSFNDDLFVILRGTYHLYWAPLSDHHLDFAIVVEGYSLREVVPRGSDRKSYLVESGGQLLFVIMTVVNNGVTDISIFRADFEAGEWVKLDGVGAGAIFLDEASTSGYSYPNAHVLGLRANSVYYTLNKRRALFIYDIQDQSISMSLPCDIADFCSTLAWMFIQYKT